jgi:HD-like signal output (HDOD) protein
MTNTQAPSFDLKKILTAEQLPALPQSAIRLLKLSQDPHNGPKEFAEPVEADPGLTGQVLRFVNSSYFGFSGEISSVKLAITLVGIRTIRNFVLWSAVFSLIPNPQCGPFDLRRLWQDSLRRGLFARKFGAILGLKDAEEAFAAALLQDMAIPLLAKASPDKYKDLLDARLEGRRRLSELEEREFCWTHAAAAGAMARHWSLPKDLAAALEQHHNPSYWLSQPTVNPEGLAVAMSALMPSVSDPDWQEYAIFEELFRRIAPSGSPSLVELFSQVDDEYVDFAPVLRLPNPSTSLAGSLEAAAGRMCEANVE